MISNIIILYFLGLAILLLSDFVGLGLFRYRNGNMIMVLLVGYLTIVATYALFKANFNSVGILVVVWIAGYVYLFCKKNRIFFNLENGIPTTVVDYNFNMDNDFCLKGKLFLEF